jgi:superfamily II DNA or RNA helicase
MSDLVKIEKFNEVHMKVTADPGVRQELMNYFSFRPPGYQFVPSYKNKVWDGYVRLYNPMRPLLYAGLVEYVKKFCEDRGYDLEIPEEMTPRTDVPDDYVKELAKEIGAKLTPRDYQIQYVLNALRNNRSLSLSPTSSGKSFIIYLIQQHYWRAFEHRTLIIVPTISLVHQMAGDFMDYGCDQKDIYRIQAGIDKNTSAPIVISTWQSLVKQPKEWFEQFHVVLGDEAHNFQAKSLTTIMEKLTDAPFRHGFTGTISSESKVHRLVLEGVFGPIRRYVTTKDLMDEGTVADFKVKALVLSHNPETRKVFAQAIKPLKSQQKYAAEKTFLFNHDKRNMFIRNLVWSLKGQNNLILFDQIEKHGKILEPLLRRDDRVLHFIHGGVSGEDRENVRKVVENDPEKRHDILASYGTFSTGVSIKRIDNAIFASGYKSEIKVLQSIGRTLRKGNGSDEATLYDISDDLSMGSYTNYTLQHFRRRVEIYASEQFDFKIYTINLE